MGEEKERKSSGTEALIRDIVTIEINSNHANEERGKTSKRREENQQTQPMYDANWEPSPGHFDRRRVLPPLL